MVDEVRRGPKEKSADLQPVQAQPQRERADLQRVKEHSQQQTRKDAKHERGLEEAC